MSDEPLSKSWSVAADFSRLIAAIQHAILPAISLAMLSAVALLALSGAGMLLPYDVVAWLAVGLFLWFHGVFIVTITWHRIKSRASILTHLVHPGLAAGAILTVAIAAFAWLDAVGASHTCADGQLFRDSAVPDWPWLWIGWLALALSAAPARVIGWMIGEQPRMIPLGHRIGLTAAVSPAVLLTGILFQWRDPDCALPHEGFGLFEGGMFLLPLLGLFLFLLSFTLAVLAAAFVAPDTVTVRRSAEPQA